MTEFTVIRFTPNPISDESINVGIAAIEDGEVLFELVPNLSRVKAFAKDVDGGSDALKNLELFFEEFQDRADDLGRDELARIVESWTHFVQFSPLRPSKRSAEELLGQMVPVFLAVREKQQEEIEDPEGEFVRYEDHKAKCDELGTTATAASDELFKLIESKQLSSGPWSCELPVTPGLYWWRGTPPDGSSWKDGGEKILRVSEGYFWTPKPGCGTLNGLHTSDPGYFGMDDRSWSVEDMGGEWSGPFELTIITPRPLPPEVK